VRKLLAAAALIASFAGAVEAQVSQPSQNRAIMAIRTSYVTQTLTAVGPSTVNSNTFGGFGKNLTCTLLVTAQTGSPSSTWSIQGLVPGTTTWVTLLTSAAVTAINTPSTMSIGPNITTAANVGLNAVVPDNWRTQVVETGGGSTVTGTVSCTNGE